MPALSDILTIDTDLLQGDLFSDLFSYKDSTRTVVLKADKLSQLSQGIDCTEVGIYPLNFRMTSDILGTSIQSVGVGVSPINPTNKTYEILEEVI